MTSIAEIWGLQLALDAKSPVGHKHRIAEVEGLTEALQSHAEASTIPTFIGDISGLQSALDDKASIDALTGLQLEVNEKATIVGMATAFSTLQTALDSKAAATHTQAIDTITGLQTALDGKAALSHIHSNATTTTAGFMSPADKTKLDGLATSTGPVTVAIADVTGLQSALDAKADVSHTQAISTVTGLQTALDGKAALNHIHSNATSSAAGFMSSADKTKLDSLSSSGTSENTSPSLLTYTVSQSSVYGSATATYANITDNNFSTGGGTNGQTDNWIQFTFANPTIFNRITMGGATVAGFGGAAAYMNGGALEVSHDGTNWAILIQSLSGITDTATLTFAFSPITAKALRIRRQSYAAVGEFRVYG